MNQNNQLRPTPETDVAFRDGYTFCSEDMRPAVEFCANFERERDEAREQLEAMREAIRVAYESLETSSRSLHGSSYYKAQSAIAKLQPFLNP